MNSGPGDDIVVGGAGNDTNQQPWPRSSPHRRRTRKRRTLARRS
ncbi:MAG: hypothetical protein M3N56_02080 [Actinomycetota bacterium]|nr:hypothetical protein [Actinomycetota bacterium]